MVELYLVRPANIQVSEQGLRDRGVDVDSAVILPPEVGGGYMLLLEFPHQLHCVVSPLSPPRRLYINPKTTQNLLRKFSYWDYYQDREYSFKAKPDILHMHIGTS